MNGAVASWQLTLDELKKGLQAAVGQCKEALLKGSLQSDTNFMYECFARAAVGMAWLGKEFGRKDALSDADKATLASAEANQSATVTVLAMLASMFKV